MTDVSEMDAECVVAECVVAIQPPAENMDDVVPMAVQPTVEDDIVVDLEADMGRPIESGASIDENEGRNEVVATSETAAAVETTAPLQSNTCTATKLSMICIGMVLIVTVIVLGVVLGRGNSPSDDGISNNSNAGDASVHSSGADVSPNNNVADTSSSVPDGSIFTQSNSTSQVSTTAAVPTFYMETCQSPYHENHEGWKCVSYSDLCYGDPLQIDSCSKVESFLNRDECKCPPASSSAADNSNAGDVSVPYSSDADASSNNNVADIMSQDKGNYDCSLNNFLGELTVFEQNSGSTVVDDNGNGGFCYRVSLGAYGFFDHGYDITGPSCEDHEPRLSIGKYYRTEGDTSYYTGGSGLYACESFGGRAGTVKLIIDNSISQAVINAGEVSPCRYEMIIKTPNCEALTRDLKLYNNVAADAMSVMETMEEDGTIECFDDNAGGYYNDGKLHTAVRSYVDQDCSNNASCLVAQTYGWPMNSWCVKNVKDMQLLFYGLPNTFNEDISDWDTSSVINMDRMFHQASSFNSDISSWNVSSVTNMYGVFHGASSFNSDLSAWDVKRVTDVGYMFYYAGSFSQDLCAWRDIFPYNQGSLNGFNYNTAGDIFVGSGCTYQDAPQEDQKGPFCASECSVFSALPPLEDCAIKQAQAITLTTDICLRDQKIDQNSCLECPSSCDNFGSGSTFPLKTGQSYSFTINKEETDHDGIWLSLLHNTNDIYMSLYKGNFCDGLTCVESRDGGGCSGMQTRGLEDGEYILFIHGADDSATYHFDFTFTQDESKYPDNCSADLWTTPVLDSIITPSEKEDSCNVSKAEVLDALYVLADGYTGTAQYEYTDVLRNYMYGVSFFRNSEGIFSGEFKQYEGSWWSASLGSFTGEDSIIGNQVFFEDGETDGCSDPRRSMFTFACVCGKEEGVDDTNALAVERAAELPWSKASVVVTEPEPCVYAMTVTHNFRCEPETLFESNGEDDSESILAIERASVTP